MEINQKYPYHSIDIEETFEKLSADKEGLSSDEAEKRQQEFGKNVLPEKGGTNVLLLFLKQFKDFLILILFVAAGIAFWADKMTDVYIIIGVILFNAIMGFTQEYKAEKAIQAIKGLEEKKATVLRDGKEKEISAEDVVPGDILLLHEGGKIAADARLIKAKNLRTAEASLTGESMPIDKTTDITEKDASLGDRLNMVWKSTNVVNGSGKAVVTAIGIETEIGKIAKSMGEMQMQDSNFKKKTSLLGKQMAAIAIVTSIVIFSIGYWIQNYDFREILLVTIAVLVSSIPEGLPAVISIVLAIGANRMAKKNVIIREFTATEMMGSVSVILTDKTGTLTQSILVIKKIFTGSGRELAVTGRGYQLNGKFKENDHELDFEESPVERKLLAIAAYCNDAYLKDEMEGQRSASRDESDEDSDKEHENQDSSADQEKKEKEQDKDSDKIKEADSEDESEEEQDSDKKQDEGKDKALYHEEGQKDTEREKKWNEKSDSQKVSKESKQIKIEKDKSESEKQEEEKSEEQDQQNKDRDKKEEKSAETDPSLGQEEKKDHNIEVDVDVEPGKVKINVNLKTGEKTGEGEDEEGKVEEEEEEEEEDNEEEDENTGPEIAGDPTEAAMFVAGRKAKIKERKPYDQYKVLDDVPFNSDQKFRASLVDTEDGAEIFAIGAPERILDLSTEYLTPDGPKNLDEDKKKEIEDKMDEWTGQAMRVLALAYKKADGKDNISAEDVKDIIWVGITGIIDPPRKGVKESVQECKSAGIRIIMVTGDHKKTAAAIAAEVGILENAEDIKESKYKASMTTQELDVEDEKFDEYLQNVNVFARMNPDTKLRIAERLQAKDTLIAMTGDGVNDAPALKRADVGIAMGIRGTDVAKDASEIVLQDDNFSSIVNAIREGRIVFNNVRITSYYLLTTNFAFVIAFIFAMARGMPLLLTAVQILYVNLVTSGIMDVALATEPGHGEIMKQPPVKKNEKILKWDVVPYILLVSVIMVVLALLTFQYYLPEGERMARTGTFIIISMTQIFNVFNMRSLRTSIFKIGFFSNRWVNLAFAAAIIFQVAVVKIPFLIDLMEFEDFPIADFLVITIIATVIVWAGELYKYLKFKKNLF